MTIPCGESECRFQQYGECTLTHAIPGSGSGQSCAYFRAKENRR